MKKFTALLLSACIALTLVPSYAVGQTTSENMGEFFEVEYDVQSMDNIVNDDDFVQLIEDYFTLRSDILNDGNLVQPMNARLDIDLLETAEELTASSEVIEQNTERLDAISNLATYHNVYVVNSWNEISVDSVQLVSAPTARSSNSTYEVEVSEWTWIEYNDGDGGPIDEMGFGTPHVITIEQTNSNEFYIADDVYDDSQFLGERDVTFAELAQSLSVEDSLEMRPKEDNTFVTEQVSTRAASMQFNYGRSLNVWKLIQYADSWVRHGYAGSSSPNHSYYNKDRYGYYSSDCANYVSQCLYAAGMRNDYNEERKSNVSNTQWWHTGVENKIYEDYEISAKPWRYVPSFVSYWASQGYTSVPATDSNVYPGNPVVNNTSHVGICVGYNSADIPICNAHTRDVYHVPYTMMGNGNLTTIPIFNWNSMRRHPEDAYYINVTTSWKYERQRYISNGTNFFYEFDVTETGKYSFEAETPTGEEEVDTVGILYRASERIDGKTIYMVEVAYDDDSGSRNNFYLRNVELTPGTYFLLVRPYNKSEAGYFELSHRRTR